MSRRRGRRARGFTLLEVLVALAIVTVGMAAVLGTLTSSADTVVYMRDKTFASWVALNQIATVRLSGQTPVTGKSDGDVDFAGRKWHWHQEVNGTQLPGMVRIDVSARPADAKSSNDDTGWYSTMSGIYGDALGQPRGDLPDWGTQLLMPQNTAPGATPGAPAGGANIIAPGSPPAGPTAPQPLQPPVPPPVTPPPAGGS
jgi:general secretion pathway protein I